MNLVQQTRTTGFKIVCTDCGSLSIKMAPPEAIAVASGETVIECRCCSAVRGTLADLKDLARRGRDLYEF
ncbi:hypothetical protein I6F35_08750 [Bradyrhizobium sp. BRP22]|uniref:hypothetical protein n=1 Tax=Bradyrhizobium sp. BRP22 TaxID=2793821 RepID=UPI001CD631DC|nr:hypothetical protein [Bradyrhizobium sp. BRP22]MCA1453305.1 hypothetical protein [Bradyrhizobium sp. BRP22]